jgi:transcriptional regulator with XRE-family HTH domain
MTKEELQRLKIAWLAARDAGDAQQQLHILQDHPDYQNDLIDFIAAYHASGGAQADVAEIVEEQNPALELLTQRALRRAMQRVFSPSLTVKTLAELRKAANLRKTAVASGLRLSMSVWDKLERGAIAASSLSQRQLERLAAFFQISAEQFATLLDNSRPLDPVYRRQTRTAARNMQHKSAQAGGENFADAINKSDMTEEDKRFWQEE